MKPQPILDKDARFCCNHQHFSGVMLALYVDNGGNLAGVTLQGSNVDLAEIFGLADHNDFDRAIDAELAKKLRDDQETIAYNRSLDRQEAMAGY